MAVHGTSRRNCAIPLQVSPKEWHWVTKASFVCCDFNANHVCTDGVCTHTLPISIPCLKSLLETRLLHTVSCTVIFCPGSGSRIHPDPSSLFGGIAMEAYPRLRLVLSAGLRRYNAPQFNQSAVSAETMHKNAKWQCRFPHNQCLFWQTWFLLFDLHVNISSG